MESKSLYLLGCPHKMNWLTWHISRQKRDCTVDSPNGVPAPSEAVTAGQRSRRLESLTKSVCFHSDVNHIHFVVGRSNKDHIAPVVPRGEIKTSIANKMSFRCCK